MAPKHILIVDDDEVILLFLRRALSFEGFRTTVAQNAGEALTVLLEDRRMPVDFLLTDFDMPGLTGLDLIDALQREGVEVPSLVMSGNHDDTLASEALDRGCVGFLAKPFDVAALIGMVRDALEDAAVASPA